MADKRGITNPTNPLTATVNHSGNSSNSNATNAPNATNAANAANNTANPTITPHTNHSSLSPSTRFDAAMRPAQTHSQSHIMSPISLPSLLPQSSPLKFNTMAASSAAVAPSKAALFSPTPATTTTTTTPMSLPMPSVASLMSPPEATPLESFARATPMKSSASQSQKHNPPVFAKPLPSPPVSPYVRTAGPSSVVVVGDEPSLTSQPDPILYPPSSQDTQGAASPPQRPLFVDDDEAAQRIVKAHIAARRLDSSSNPASSNVSLGRNHGMRPIVREASPPHKEDYELMLNFTSRVMATYNMNPSRWHSRELEYLREDQRRRAGISSGSGSSRPLPQIAPRPAKTFKQPARSPIVKPARAPRVSTAKTSRKVRDSSTPEPGGRTGSHGGGVGGGNGGGARTISTREDKDFQSLPDYSPSLNTLPDRPNSLKVEWKGAPLDLRGDPYKHLLHDDELLLAANLRLDCATYLTSKRRIFIARLNALRIGKEFRKTDSQQACKIDVNKASKLWIAFDKVGWLRPEHVRKFLN